MKGSRIFIKGDGDFINDASINTGVWFYTKGAKILMKCAEMILITARKYEQNSDGSILPRGSTLKKGLENEKKMMRGNQFYK